MKTANKISAGLAMMLVLVLPDALSAQTPPAASVTPADVVALPPPPILTPTFHSANNATSAGNNNSSDASDNAVEARPGKTPDSIKNVLRRLSSSNNSATLEDINVARETIAKLDAQIEIEKRLNDLATIRQEREEKSFANAIPASALTSARRQPEPVSVTPPPTLPVSAPPQRASVPLSMRTEAVEVDRVSGAGGHFTAIVKLADGKTTTVKVGDKLSGGETVRAISSGGVLVGEGKTEHLYPVKNITTVYNGR